MRTMASSSRQLCLLARVDITTLWLDTKGKSIKLLARCYEPIDLTWCYNYEAQISWLQS